MTDITTFDIDGLLLIKPKIFEDDRGFFLESYKQNLFEEKGMPHLNFVQDNHSHSSKGVLRGLHFQTPPYAQDKLVRVTRGRVIDVAVDIRTGSPTYGKHVAIELSEENKHIFFIPKGFAHGFSVLSEKVDFLYRASNYYNKESEGGLMWNDKNLNIDWGISEPILSAKDQLYPTLSEFISPFIYEN